MTKRSILVVANNTAISTVHWGAVASWGRMDRGRMGELDSWVLVLVWGGHVHIWYVRKGRCFSRVVVEAAETHQILERFYVVVGPHVEDDVLADLGVSRTRRDGKMMGVFGELWKEHQLRVLIAEVLIGEISLMDGKEKSVKCIRQWSVLDDCSTSNDTGWQADVGSGKP